MESVLHARACISDWCVRIPARVRASTDVIYNSRRCLGACLAKQRLLAEVRKGAVHNTFSKKKVRMTLHDHDAVWNFSCTGCCLAR